MGFLRLTPSDLQHLGSSLKDASSIQGEAEVSGTKVRAGGQKAIASFLNTPHAEPLHQKTSTICESED